MIFDLSSKITLERIPKQYYRPADALEATRQSRFEKLRTDIYETDEEGSKVVAWEIAELIRTKEKENDNCVLGLSGGSSPLRVYQELVRLHKKEGFSFKHVYIFNVTEFYPIKNNEHSNAKLLREYLLDEIDFPEDHFFTPQDIEEDKVFEFCKEYEQKIEDLGGLDFVLVSVGVVGNLAYNEPGSQPASTTRLMLLDEPTASLDNKTKILVKDMLIKLKNERTSMIGIFHDLEFMDGVCDKVFNISEGKIV